MKKYIPEHKVQRMRNLATKKFGAKTKVMVGYGKIDKEHVEGDVWEEANKTWTIKNGITQTLTKLDKARTTALMPLFCPKCNDRLMKGQMDKLFWKLYGECSKCRISYETKLKICGEYSDYAHKIRTENATDWMTDLGDMAKDFIEATNKKGYITETGKIEDWSNQNKEEIKSIVSENVETIKTKITDQLEKMNKAK